MTVGAPPALLAGVAVLAVGALVRVLPAPPARRLPAGLPRPEGQAGSPPAGRAARRFVERLVGSRWRRRRDRQDRRAAWPSVADEVGAGLRSGASLRQALESAASRGGAAGETLRAVLVPVARGDPLARAANRWAHAAGEPDEALLAEAVELASTAARADPMLFDVVADTVRDRAAIAGELRAQTAQARASALALSVLPLAFTGLLALTDPGVLAFLLGTLGGWLCLTVGLTLQAAGGWWMHRIVTEASR